MLSTKASSLIVYTLSLHDRTDRGVHALCSSAHIDLERPDGLKYDPAYLTATYNRYFAKAGLDLR